MLLLEREVLPPLRDHRTRLKSWQYCLTLHPQGGCHSSCDGGMPPSPLRAEIWAACLIAMAFPTSPLICPWSNGGLSNYAQKHWVDLCGRQSHTKVGAPSPPAQRHQEPASSPQPQIAPMSLPHTPAWPSQVGQRLCSPHQLPVLRAVPSGTGFSWLPKLHLVPPASPAAPSIAELPSVWYKWHFLSHSFPPATTFSCQLPNMAITHGAHIKAKLPWCSSFHMLLSPSICPPSLFYFCSPWHQHRLSAHAQRASTCQGHGLLPRLPSAESCLIAGALNMHAYGGV